MIHLYCEGPVAAWLTPEDESCRHPEADLRGIAESRDVDLRLRDAILECVAQPDTQAVAGAAGKSVQPANTNAEKTRTRGKTRMGDTS